MKQFQVSINDIADGIPDERVSKNHEIAKKSALKV